MGSVGWFDCFFFLFLLKFCERLGCLIDLIGELVRVWFGLFEGMVFVFDE